MKLLLTFLFGLLTIVIVLASGFLAAPLRERFVCLLQKRKASRARWAKRYDGHLLAYWETGWEGRVVFTVSVPGLGRPLPLENGQRLTIYAEDGSVLWSGILCFVKVRWWDHWKYPHKIWSFEKQAGVSYTQWIAWFMRQPPLKATVEMSASF